MNKPYHESELEQAVLNPLRQTTPKFWLVMGGLGLLFLWGAVSLVRQWVLGLGVTGLSRPVYWGIYLCYNTIRADSFQFMCRKLSPALAPLAVGAAVALGELPRRARYAVFAVVTVVSLGVASEFFVQFLGERGVGPPRFAGPAGGPARLRRVPGTQTPWHVPPPFL